MLPLPDRSRTVSVLAFDGMSPFELGCVVEVFGLPRPELDVPWYELAVCAERPGPLRAVGGFTIEAAHGLDVFAGARTVIVPGVPDVRAEISPPSRTPCAGRTTAGHGSCRSARARSRSPPPGCSTGGPRRPTGGTPRCSSGVSPRSGWIPECCTWTRATC